jgi:PAT family beta-lactamase induction signal transducer AmpG
VDRLPPPLPLGRRRGWGITIQIALLGATIALGTSDPKRNLTAMAALALLVAFLSASQDIVIDAWRVEMLPLELQGSGAATYQTGYRIGMLVAGAGALAIAAHSGWFVSYATMAALLVVGMLVFLFGPEPNIPLKVSDGARRSAWATVRSAVSTAVIGPFADFMRKPFWLLILVVILDYKLGEGMTGVMSTPLYIALGFTLNEIAVISKIFGFFSIVLGALLGGVVTVRFGLLRSMVLCGILQAIGNLFFVLQAVGGHRVGYLALCVTAENITGGMAGTAFIAYISSLCSPQFTATQYALFASLALFGRTIIGSTGGALSEAIGWVPFFLLTTIASVPALGLLVWIDRRVAARSDRPRAVASLAGERNL